MKKLLILLSFVIVGFILFTGQKSQDEGPRWNKPHTAVYPSGNYIPLPVGPDVYTQFTTQPRVVVTPYEVLLVNPNIRVLPSTSTAQTEVILFSNPVNRDIMFGSSNSVTGSTINSGCYVTTNGGANWYGWHVINEPNANDQRGDPGPVIDKNGTFLFSHLTSSTNFGSVTGIGCNRSTNNGANWDATIQVETSTSADKNLSGTDDSPTSPYYGYSYAVWCVLTSPANSRVARTTNSGLNWTTQTIGTSVSGHYSQGHDVACGPNGEVYVVWVSNISSSPYTADYLAFAKSTNGGVNYTSTENMVDVNGARSTGLSPWTVRTNDFPRIDVDKSGGPRNGWIYVVMNEINHSPVAGSDPDVVLYRSTNGGTNWTGVRVNQDPINNGVNQIFPCVKVDPYGGVNVIYYDARQWAPNDDSAAVYLSRSLDGGSTWTDVEISDHHFRPKTATGMGGNYFGDYIGIAYGGGKIWGIWMDDKAGTSGFYNTWVGSFNLGPSISHTPLGNTEQISGTRAVNCTITPAGSGLITGRTKLYYSKNNTVFTDSLNMTNSGGNNWTANITLSGAGLYRYYIKTIDSLNRIATSPGGAPANYHSFIASTDTTKPVITHTPLLDVPKNAWPANVSATVTDNIGVDSVWVRWYKNNTSTGIKHFKLINTSGSSYSANFNSDTSQVNFNDSIFYRVFARDNSSMHNTDSTALNKFKIIAQATATIGTGTTANGWPFYTFYMDSRTDMLFTKTEILTGGGARGYITKIGFDVVSAASQVMNGFNVKMQNYTDSSLTTFVSTGWTIPYSGTYTVPGTGWQYINLTTPFYWNGTSNLLIEICFDNSSYTSNTTVNSTANTLNQNKHQHTDLSSGSGCTDITSPGSSYTARPNIKLVINMVTGTEENIISSIPDKFALSQNYPNPFNPVTKISFDIAKSTFTKLKVYDVIGREIMTLINEVRNPGSYIIDFDGSTLSSGVYYYRLEAGDFVDVKKMILVK